MTATSNSDRNTMRIRHSFAALALALAARALGAQEQEEGGRWAVGVAIGDGPHTTRVGDTYFREDVTPTTRLSIARLGEGGRVRVVLRAEFVPAWGLDRTDDCPIAPNGGCREYFPDNDGGGVGVGADARLLSRLSSTVLIGGGRYGGSTRAFGELEMAVGFGSHLMLTAASRHMTWKEPDIGRLWYRPIYAGVRWQW
jgi:hypothetical protein